MTMNSPRQKHHCDNLNDLDNNNDSDNDNNSDNDNDNDSDNDNDNNNDNDSDNDNDNLDFLVGTVDGNIETAVNRMFLLFVPLVCYFLLLGVVYIFPSTARQ